MLKWISYRIILIVTITYLVDKISKCIRYFNIIIQFYKQQQWFSNWVPREFIKCATVFWKLFFIYADCIVLRYEQNKKGQSVPRKFFEEHSASCLLNIPEEWRWRAKYLKGGRLAAKSLGSTALQNWITSL